MEDLFVYNCIYSNRYNYIISDRTATVKQKGGAAIARAAGPA